MSLTLAAGHPTDAFTQRRRWWCLAVLTLALGVVTIGNGAVNIALPVLARELDADTQDLQWVASAYGLALAGLLFTGGALGDRFGRKGGLLAGLAMFIAASCLAAVDGTLESMVLARVLMGVSAALILPCSMAILIAIFDGPERNKAIGIWTSALGIAGSMAPVATGFTLAHADYRAVFLLAVPPALVAVLGGAVLLPRSRDPERAPLDLLGGVLSTAGIVALVYAIVEGPSHGWTSALTAVTLVTAALFLTLFVLWELRTANPMIEIRLFTNAPFLVGVVGTILLFLSMQGVMFLTAQHLQLVDGHSPLVAGLVNIPWGLMIFVASTNSARLAQWWGGARTVAAAASLVAVALVGLALLVHPGVSLWQFTLLMCLFHIGFGLGMAPLTVAIMRHVPARRAGGGGALNSFSREVGGALGVAVIGSLAASVYASRLTEQADQLPAALGETMRSSLGEALIGLADYDSQAWSASVASAARAAFDQGFAVGLIIIAMAMVLLAVAAWRCLPRD